MIITISAVLLATTAKYTMYIQLNLIPILSALNADVEIRQIGREGAVTAVLKAAVHLFDPLNHHQ